MNIFLLHQTLVHPVTSQRGRACVFSAFHPSSSLFPHHCLCCRTLHFGAVKRCLLQLASPFLQARPMRPISPSYSHSHSPWPLSALAWCPGTLACVKRRVECLFFVVFFFFALLCNIKLPMWQNNVNVRKHSTRGPASERRKRREVLWKRVNQRRGFH